MTGLLSPHFFACAALLDHWGLTSFSFLRVTSKIPKGSEDEDDDDDDSIDWGPDSEDETSSSDGDGGADNLRFVRGCSCRTM